MNKPTADVLAKAIEKMVEADKLLEGVFGTMSWLGRKQFASAINHARDEVNGTAFKAAAVVLAARRQCPVSNVPIEDTTEFINGLKG